MCSISGKKVLLYDQAVTAMNELMNKKILIVDDEKELQDRVGRAVQGGLLQYLCGGELRGGTVRGGEPAGRADAAGRKSPRTAAASSCTSSCANIRTRPSSFSRRGSGEDRITGLRLGADDYIVKPFLMRELMLRVKALLRRTYAIAAEEQGAEIGSCYVDFSRACVRRGDADTRLRRRSLF